MWTLADKELSSRLLLGTAQYPSLHIMREAITASKAAVVTVSLKRQSPQKESGHTFWDSIKKTGCQLLPNTAGCHTALDAIATAEMAREIFQTNWIKLEVIGDDYNLQPDPFELLKAAQILVQKGFEVFPYCTDDFVLCQRLIDCGCRILMPWGAPIGSGKGLINPYALENLRHRLPMATLIIDAGIGKPSHAVQTMELGFDAVLLNTAVSLAKNPVQMATAFKDAVIAGRMAFEAGMMIERNMAHPSTFLLDTPFWHQREETTQIVHILNLPELENIVGDTLKSYADIEKSAQKILSSGTKNIVVTLPSLKSSHFSQTYYTNGMTSFWLSSQNSQTHADNIKSIFSSAMTNCLEAGYDTKDAVVIAQMYLNKGEKSLEEQIDLPFLVDHPIDTQPAAFNDFGSEKIGLYPIIDSVEWLKKLLPLDIHTFQLRIKNKQGEALENEIQQGIEIAKKYGKKLFINDYWQLAIRYGAYGVHLGQEDLNTADIAKIYQAGLRLGISTHCYYEVARAHAFRPSYIACGPIFSTTSKVMSFAPQGIAQLKRWRRILNYPLVAIGGIYLEQLPEILATNVDGVAMISAITQADDPILFAQKLSNMVDAYAHSG